MLDNKKVYKNGKYLSVTPHFAGTSSLVSVDGTATIIKTMSRNTDWSRAFDDDVTTYFRSGISEPVNRYIGLSFVEPCVVTMYHLVNIYNSSWSAKTFYLAARNNDSEEWVKLGDEHTVTKDDWTNAGENGLCFQVKNNTAYIQYAIFVTAKNSTNSISFSTIEFYKDDVMNNMTFVKCLESNTPQEVTGGEDKVFLTDEGNIYMSKKDGSLKKMGGSGEAPFIGTEEEWEALSLEEKAKYKIVNFLDDDGSGGSVDKYSTEEVKTNKVWIDGKPIYRKCFNLAGYINGATYSSVGIIKPENFETLVSISTNSPVDSLYYFNADLQMVYAVNVTVSVTGFIAYLEYTKTN